MSTPVTQAGVAAFLQGPETAGLGLCLQPQGVSDAHLLASRSACGLSWGHLLVASCQAGPLRTALEKLCGFFHFLFWTTLNVTCSLQVLITELVLYGIFLK